MSTITVERLDETMLASSPPCQVIIAGAEPCGKPAAFRIKSACPCKPNHPPDFICTECLADLKNGFMQCTPCRAIVTSWEML